MPNFGCAFWIVLYRSRCADAPSRLLIPPTDWWRSVINLTSLKPFSTPAPDGMLCHRPPLSRTDVAPAQHIDEVESMQGLVDSDHLVAVEQPQQSGYIAELGNALPAR